MVGDYRNGGIISKRCGNTNRKRRGCREVSKLQKFIDENETTLNLIMADGDGSRQLARIMLGLIEAVKDDMDCLEGDVEVVKMQTPPPQGFDSWEQFDNGMKLVSEKFNNE